MNKNIIQWTRLSDWAKFYLNTVTKQVANIHKDGNIGTYFKLTKDTIKGFIRSNK